MIKKHKKGRVGTADTQHAKKLPNKVQWFLTLWEDGRRAPLQYQLDASGELRRYRVDLQP